MRVITYTNPLALQQHADWPLIQNSIHLCATNTLAKGLQDRYAQIASVSLAFLLRDLLPRWVKKETQLEQYALLTGIIERVARERPEWSQRLRAFRRNQAELLKGIRTLAEGGLSPNDLSCDAPDEEIFQVLWQRLEAEAGWSEAMQSLLYGRFNNPTLFRERFHRALSQAMHRAKLQAEPPSRLPTCLILHGFYFITPLQMRLIRLLQTAGVELLFLNCWDERYPYLFRSLDRFFPDRSVWKPQVQGVSGTPAGDFLAAVCEGQAGPSVPDEAALPLLRFTDLASFLSWVRSNRQRPPAEREVLVSPASDELNDLLRQYFPEEYPERHFLSHPIGQFLFHLHSMWDEERGALVLTPEAVTACFHSGLLSVEHGGQKLNGQGLMRALRRAMPYFAGLTLAAEWDARAKQLAALLRSTVHRWDPAVEPVPEHRFRIPLENPVRLLSHLTLKPEEAAQISLLVTHLHDLGKAIFAERSHASVGAHMRHLRQLLKAGGSDSALARSEQALLSQVLDRLERESENELELPVKDLAEAIALYLGSIGRSESAPFEAGSETEAEVVQPLAALDGLPLSGRPLHLCLLQEKALPQRRRAFPWPLRPHSFRKVQGHDAYRMLLWREETDASASLYLLYAGVAFADRTTLSWVSEWHGDKQQESVYLLMLKEAGLLERAASAPGWQPGAAIDVTVLQPRVPSWDRTALSPHAVAEYAACPRRFYYSYLTAPHPVFESAFLYEFLYGRLTAWHRERFRSNPADARAQIERLFPAWSQSRFRDLAERWGGPLDGSDEYGGRQYSAVHRWLLFPAYTQVTPARRVFEDPTRFASLRERMGEGQELEFQMAADPGEACRFCPHTDRCSASLFPIDTD